MAIPGEGDNSSGLALGAVNELVIEGREIILKLGKLGKPLFPAVNHSFCGFDKFGRK